MVEWTVTVATGSHTPVQESSSASRQESSHMSSLAVDGPRSLKLTSLPIGYAALFLLLFFFLSFLSFRHEAMHDYLVSV